MRKSIVGGALLVMLGIAPFGVIAQEEEQTGADEGGIAVELNRLESVDEACRAYFVVQNDRDERLSELQVDAFLFDVDGVILSRWALAFEGVRPNRNKIVMFDFDAQCDDIGRLMVNEVLDCRTESGPLEACADRFAVSSRAPVELEY